MKELIYLPTYILVKLILHLLPNNHTLKNITLAQWVRNSTALATLFSVFYFLINAIITGYCIFKILNYFNIIA